ncbi:MAG TPA: DUF1993 domain-containing protein [Casimicrobiaceae bacterium]|jgi:hypothetical protein
MPLSMYQLTVPVFVRALRNLRGIVEKGAAYSSARKLEDSVLLGARLYPDMLPFTFQIQVATDMAKGGAARLAGQEPPKYEDNETTFAQLIDRVDRTIAYIESLDRKAFDGAEERTIVRPVRGQPHTFTGLSYVQQTVLPNLYFHSAIAYGLLRHSGVELGKFDYLGQME